MKLIQLIKEIVNFRKIKINFPQNLPEKMDTNYIFNVFINELIKLNPQFPENFWGDEKHNGLYSDVLDAMGGGYKKTHKALKIYFYWLLRNIIEEDQDQYDNNLFRMCLNGIFDRHEYIIIPGFTDF